MGTAMKSIVLLVIVGLVCSTGAKPRGQQSRAPHLDHELTNRMLHADRSRHHEHPGQHHSAALLPPSTSTSSNSEHKRQHGHAPDHSVHKKLLQEQEQEELLAGERLMHVRPRYTAAPLLTGGRTGSFNATGEAVRGTSKSKQQQRKHPQPISNKALKLAKVTTSQQGTKAHGATKGGALAGSNFTKEYKGHRAPKKYNPKKHYWKKTQHKDKVMRNRQNKRESMKKNKDGVLALRTNSKKEKAANKEIMKAKELLRKEKALKKRERREKRAKIMAYRKRE